MKAKDIAIQVLLDAREYLDRLSTEDYARPLDLLSGASIGQHTRHFVEFYQCLLAQIANPVEPVIDYAARMRNLMIEADPVYTASLIDDLASQLSSLTEDVHCRLECAEHFSSEKSYTVASSLERELIYNIEHTIHHLAIIKIGLKYLNPEIVLADHFGVAPSTVKYQSECAQ